jgi:hypothetical protein
MKKLSILCGALLMLGATANAQLQEEQNVTITMDLQPVLELEMTTARQISFQFDEISDYYAGIIQYGVTKLNVSSTVSWDLYAVGRNADGGAGIWDAQVQYGPATANSVSQIPLGALQIRQNVANPASAGPDYFDEFTTGTDLSVFYNADNSATAPSATQKYIAGHKGTTTATESVAGGSYLTNGADYTYTLDYRIKPGLPAQFPDAFLPDGTPAALTGAEYAHPGLYTMYVQYILLEDQ